MIKLSRRLAPALTLATALLGAAYASQAEPVAQVRSQAPGFYRMALGDLEVTALYDGYVDLDQKLLKGIHGKDLQALFARSFIDAQRGVQTAVNGYLINTGKQLVLVDTGAAQCFGPTLGRLSANLAAAGYKPEQVDTVLLTHLHPDHACGIASADGKPAFPNATVRVAQAEADYWLDEQRAARAPQAEQGLFKMAREAVAPYHAAGRFKTYQAGETLLPGVEAVPTPGHTPGHTSYLFRAQGQRLLVWGDLMHSHSVQFRRPEVSMEFDVDQPRAIASRKRVLADAARDKLWIAGAHLPFPGIGHVRAERQGYNWVPAEYGPLRSDR